MKMSGRYAPGLYAGVVGILSLVAINAFTIPDSLNAAKERERLNAEAELEKARAEATKKVADAYAENAIANFDQLIVDGYTLTNTPPNVNLKLVDPFKKTFIFDQQRQCVGYALQGKFYFIKYYEGACNDKR